MSGTDARQYGNQQQRRLSREIKTLRKVMGNCETQTRLTIERRRMGGQTAEERMKLRREIGSSWKGRFEEIVRAYAILSRYYDTYGETNPEDTSPAESANFKKLLDESKAYIDKLRAGQPADTTDKQLVAMINRELNDYAELKFIMGEAESGDEETSEGADIAQWKNGYEVFRAGEKDRSESKTEYMEITVVDEFGQPINLPKEPVVNKEMEENAAQVVFSSDRNIIFAQPSAKQEQRAQYKYLPSARSAGEFKSMRAIASQAAREARRRQQLRSAADARSAGELQKSGVNMTDIGWSCSHTASSSSPEVVTAGRAPTPPTTSGRIPRNYGRIAMKMGPKSRASRVPSPVPSPIASPRVGDSNSVNVAAAKSPATTSAGREVQPMPPTPPKKAKRWNGCQKDWARMLANSGGRPYLEQLLTEAEAKIAENVPLEQRIAEAKEQKAAKLRVAQERSLLIGLMTSPVQKESTGNEEMRRKMSDGTCDRLLASLVQPGASNRSNDQTRINADDLSSESCEEEEQTQ